MVDMSREPSMEDILSSIRRVIARDEAQIQSRLAARVVPVSEVLQQAQEAEAKVRPPAAEAPLPVVEPVEAEPAVETEQDADASLVSSNAADATRQSLEALNAAFAKPRLSPKCIADLILENRLQKNAPRGQLHPWVVSKGWQRPPHPASLRG